MTALDDRKATSTTHLTIDGTEIEVPKGTLIIRAAEQAGIQIPRFCDHPLLAPVGACRQCLVDVEGQRKPVASCTTPVADDMVVHTQHSSEVAASAQRGVMELLLINHPLDCPVCDKGGECPLQNQAMSSGRAQSRFIDTKRIFEKPVALSSEILLDRERCVLCARCTRFSDEIAGDPLIDLADRGALQQVSAYAEQPFESYFSGNTVQICPVGALTGKAYRFRARPFDLVSTPSACEHCASGCAQRTDHRRGKVLRRLAGDDPEVNEEWNCDKGRWAFTYTTATDRLRQPLVRGTDGELHETSWGQALAAAATGLSGAIRDGVGVLTGGRLTVEDAYAYSRFARTVLHTNDIDFRVREHSDEETGFLAAHVAGRAFEVTYDDLSAAPSVLLVGFEPEEESPIVYLRLRRAVRTAGLRVHTVAPFVSAGNRKLKASLVQTRPGGEASALNTVDRLVAQSGSIIIVGERLAATPGGLFAAAALAGRTGASLAWIPRRAGDRGAVEAGVLPNLLPGGNPVSDAGARARFARLWGASDLPATHGRPTSGILAAGRYGYLSGLIVAGVDIDDLPDPAAVEAALENTPFVLSLETRRSPVTERADVVLPVAAVAEKSGTFVDWEGRPRRFAAALGETGMLPDHRVLTALAQRLGVDLDCDSGTAIGRQLADITPWSGPRPVIESDLSPTRRRPAAGEAILASWRMLLDAGRLQDNEPHLAGTARRPVARLSAKTAGEIGALPAGRVTVSTLYGAISLPLELDDLPDRVVWLPLNSPGSQVYRTLRVGVGQVVSISPDTSATPGSGDGSLR
ncbi:NADH-quinone oxidoreductase subunit G [Gordonia amarae]|uniref:NADH-quinone oxidoreductase n=2 Tax=Gordonia amarae TaxID=36821 RepID=G7GM65_9ACTN|nr:NADH-quinone oxidoreductase subunit G [Gordonia amarae]MCS3876379.1 NADH-quinone oxidoreductase subunit G [Gordonia amarae]QHN19299.1 NADH-quinone oxidoreductase subunit G [Gordonia amarae]QHN23775.1 NADH-quinone oxidoreductase subunit G [Gordonia amarae]QHN32687.1 NADH-quinone oxidoreductase subunit G [Gordonia amarae]QHN41435.1 NADH-quinone oxidoreductase subunit G [Gordonia amarae]